MGVSKGICGGMIEKMDKKVKTKKLLHQSEGSKVY